MMDSQRRMEVLRCSVAPFVILVRGGRAGALQIGSVVNWRKRGCAAEVGGR